MSNERDWIKSLLKNDSSSNGSLQALLDCYDPFRDYENDRDVYLMKFVVYGGLDYIDDIPPSGRRDYSYVEGIEATEDLIKVLIWRLEVWLKPFIIIEKHPSYWIVKDRGFRFRAWIYGRRIEDLVDSIPKKWLRIRGKKARHVIITITCPRRLKLFEAYKYMKKRLQSIIKYFDRHYGLNGYFGVWEVQRDGYPHIHLVLFTRKWLKVFKYKGIWRFKDKKAAWERDLQANEENGFIDCFALNNCNKKSLEDYFGKYISKCCRVNAESLKALEECLANIACNCSLTNGGSANNESSSSVSIDLKPFTLFILRLFRTRFLIVSRSLRKRLHKIEEKRREAWKKARTLNENDPGEKLLYELGELMHHKPSSLEDALKWKEKVDKLLNDLRDEWSRQQFLKCVKRRKLAYEWLRAQGFDPASEPRLQVTVMKDSDYGEWVVSFLPKRKDRIEARRKAEKLGGKMRGEYIVIPLPSELQSQME